MKQRSYIPDMTHRLGQHWQQPSSEEWLFDSKCALMSRSDCDKLLNYSTSTPSGVYAGKMWKSFHRWLEKDKRIERWYLNWYDPTKDDDLFKVECREILIVD